MKTDRTTRAVIVLLVCILAGLTWSTPSTAQPKPTRAEFMRQKLEFSKKALEGLTLENFDAIASNARALKLLSQASEWEVPTIPNANEYISLTTEFQKAADDMRHQAKDKNLDGATLAYLRLTMTCVRCHRFVRTPK